MQGHPYWIRNADLTVVHFPQFYSSPPSQHLEGSSTLRRYRKVIINQVEDSAGGSGPDGIRPVGAVCQAGPVYFPAFSYSEFSRKVLFYQKWRALLEKTDPNLSLRVSPGTYGVNLGAQCAGS